MVNLASLSLRLSPALSFSLYCACSDAVMIKGIEYYVVLMTRDNPYRPRRDVTMKSLELQCYDVQCYDVQDMRCVTVHVMGCQL